MLLTLAVEPNAKRSRRMKRIEYGQDSGSLSHARLIPVVVTKGVPCVLPPIAVGKILLCHRLNPGTWKHRAHIVLEVVGSLLGRFDTVLGGSADTPKSIAAFRCISTQLTA